MDEEEHLHRFGTPLEPLEKDEVPAKKPLSIEDQIVKDENGKRRFHGAFTGGFSAGFWNTVGSLEGWTPQNFKSSRGEKAAAVQQRPEDFMDKEDLGEFGIAPQSIRTRDEFAKDSEKEQRTGQRKRKLMQPQVDGPIPGVPVLEQLLRPVRDKVAVRILKSMGWKPGQGVGPRQTRKEKRQTTARNQREQYLLEHYGNEGLPSSSKADDDEEPEEEDDEDITFAPDDYEPIFYTPKENRFGMSYSGLSRAPVLSKGSTPAAPMQHINLFGQLEAAAKQKQLSIRGQAFGVGAFEEEDDDIYARDDMTRYDFSLADKQPKKKKVEYVQQRHVIDGFSEDKSNSTLSQPYTIDLPRDFQPRNWLHRRSRFAPMDAQRARRLEQAQEHKKAGLGRHDLNPEQRAELLGEVVQTTKKNPFKTATSVSNQQERSKSLLELISAKSDNFTKGGLITTTGEEQPAPSLAVELNKELQQTNASILQQAASKTKNLASTTPSGGFKPFLADEAKQQRYEQFLSAKLKDDAEITQFLADLQPVTLSLWDREMEKKEFIQAAKIYRPLAGLMLDRFVSEATVQAEHQQEQLKSTEPKKIVMTRTKSMWKPNALLCKRYNIAEPFGGALPDPEKDLKGKPKMSIFDYLETSINTKANFQTPNIIPKHIEPPQKPSLPSEQPRVAVELPLKSVEQSAKPVEMIERSETASETPAIKPSFVPRTPLELAVDASRDQPISEKTDLFRSIFDDSDEETDTKPAAVEEEAQQTAAEKLAAMQAALGIPITAAVPASAAAANVLRNNSPPRGLFAALFKPSEEQPSNVLPPKPKFAPIEGNKLKIAYKSREERLKNDKELAMAEVPPEELYGPKLPSQLKQPPPGNDSKHAEANIDAKLQQLWQQHAPSKRKAEHWVERTMISSDDSADSDEDSSESSDSSSSKAKRAKLKKSHKKSSGKKPKKSKQKVKKKSKKSEKSKHKLKKKKSKH
ncbi:G patch domain-containing protein 1 homolog [Drosophila sulfurigaster albostrigata]|uniref:G patch domain-containing protein 1 homolog n=1 Tax=Drosophila sulfurigaster albostrigata TaxID=89887 RepID=UPI002D21CA08|nr:G patch domain-containing protein 1 homolog [Drosophila sulfurigaster albostrigata]